MAYMTESQLRGILQKRVAGRTQKAVAKEAGISTSMMSMLINGAPMTGKILAYLGYRKVKQRLYQSVK